MPSPTPATASSSAQNPKPYPPRAQACDCLVFALFLLTSAFFICLLPAVLLVLIFFQPRLPEFTLDSSSLSIVNTSATFITADWNVTVSFTNPNTRRFSYDKMVSAALNLSNNQSLSTETISPFSQQGETQESRSPVLRELSFQVNDGCGGGPQCGSVKLRMEIQGRVGYGGWTWPVKRDRIKVVCEEVGVEFGSNVTTLAFGARKCEVDGGWKRLVRKCNSLFWNYIYVAGVVLFILSVSF